MHTTNISFVVNGIKAAGGEIPKPVVEIQESRTKVIGKAGETHGTQLDVVRVWTDETLAGRDPFKSDALQRAVLLASLSSGELRYQASMILEDRIAEAMKATVDQILAPFKTAVAAANESLTDAFSILGNLELSDTSRIFNLGSKAVEAHQSASAALSTVRTINTAWEALAHITGFAAPTTPFIDRMTDASAEQHSRLRNTKDAWVFITEGLTLDMATSPEQIKERAASRTKEEAARALQDEEARTDLHRSIKRVTLDKQSASLL